MFSFAQYLYTRIKLNPLMMSNASINIKSNRFITYYEGPIPKFCQKFVLAVPETISYVQFYIFSS